MRKIPFFDYPRLWIDEREELIKIIDEVSMKGGFIMQEELSNFESELSNYVDNTFAVGVANATDAMEIFLQAINLKKGDEIITPCLNFGTAVSSILLSGAKPKFIDVDIESLQINVENIKKNI